MRKDEPAILPAEAAELLGVEASTLRQWRWRGEGPPHYKISRQRVVYLRSEVLEWRDRGRVDPVDEGPLRTDAQW